MSLLLEHRSSLVTGLAQSHRNRRPLPYLRFVQEELLTTSTNGADAAVSARRQKFRLPLVLHMFENARPVAGGWRRLAGRRYDAGTQWSKQLLWSAMLPNEREQ